MGRRARWVVVAVALMMAVSAASAVAAETSGSTELRERPGTTITHFVDGSARATPGVPFMGQARRRTGTANQAVAGSFTVSYVGEVPDDVKTVVDRAMEIWSDAINLNAKAPVEMSFQWTEFDLGILGQASANGFYKRQTDPFWMPASLTNHRFGVDQNGADEPELSMRLNSALGDFWHLDVSKAPPSGKVDLLSTVLHEIGHGMGFVGGATLNDSGDPILDGSPDVYDALVRNGDSALLDTPSDKIGAALVGGDLSIDIGGGRTYPIHAPDEFQSGTSYSHFSDFLGDGDAGYLMGPALAPGEATRTLDAPVLGVLEGLGWALNAPALALALTQPAVTDTSVSISWSDDLSGTSPPAASVRVEAVGPSGPEALLTVAGLKNTAVLTGLQPGTAYTLRVTPLNRAGSAGPVSTATFQTTGQPPSNGDPDPSPGEPTEPEPTPEEPTPEEPANPAPTPEQPTVRKLPDLTLAETVDEIVNANNYDPAVDPEILRLYKAFFNREPDPAGAIYWIRVSRGDVPGIPRTNTVVIAQNFTISSPEFQTFYASAPTNEAFLTAVYGNVLDRISDPTGFAYWLDVLGGTNNSGNNPQLARADRGEVVFWVAKGAEFVTSNPYLPE